MPEEGEVYSKLESAFNSRANAESILSLCDYDFELARSIAEQAVSLFHGNAKLIEELYERFSGDLRKGISYLSDFKRNLPQDSTTSHCRAALGILTAFGNDVHEISEYFTLFENNISTGATFLERFKFNVTEAKSFLEKFDNNGQRASAYLEKFQGNTDEASQFLGRFRGWKEADDFLERFSDNVEEAKQNKQKEEEEKKWTTPMKPFLKLFNGDKEETKKFVMAFRGTVADAATFINKFESTKHAEEHLKKVNKNFDDKRNNSCGANCKWVFDKKTKTLFIRGKGRMNDYETANDVPTTPWSSTSEQIENVVISEGVTTIGDGAFFKCSSLTSIDIPYGVIAIGGYALSECSSLTLVIIPDSVTTIGRSAFSKCPALTALTIPNSVTTIENYAFSSGSLMSISIPSSVTAIGSYAFSDCPSLTSGTLDSIKWSLDKGTGEMCLTGKGKMMDSISYP